MIKTPTLEIESKYAICNVCARAETVSKCAKACYRCGTPYSEQESEGTQAMTHPIDEAALKAGISDEEIEAIAMQCCGELHGDELHMKRHQRIAFARALLHRSQPVAAEQAEDSAMLDWLETHPCSVSHGIGGWRTSDLRTHFNLRAALRAAIGRNREAGNADQG